MPIGRTILEINISNSGLLPQVGKKRPIKILKNREHNKAI
jgi:hypothetical protein